MSLSLFLVIFNVLGSCLLSEHHLIAVRLEHHVEVALEFEPSFLDHIVHLGKHMRINVLEYVFVASEVLLQQAKVLFALIDEVGNDFEHTWLADIFTVQVDEVATVADVPIKLRWNTLSPEHVDHFVLVFVRQLSAYREWVQILNKQHVNV